ncbi:MAG: hypothetical protein P1V20_24660 [Verrucomicrobiales bacterium]|nr:hypothetical protein [Verrucomicrobiales bacterium]
MSENSNPGPYAHSLDEKSSEDWEPLFSEDCAALDGYGNHCKHCENLDPKHGHLNKVAWWTATFAAEMFTPGSKESKAAWEWGYLAGLWHDLGKFAPEWQEDLIKATDGEADRGPAFSFDYESRHNSLYFFTTASRDQKHGVKPHRVHAHALNLMFQSALRSGTSNTSRNVLDDFNLNRIDIFMLLN